LTRLEDLLLGDDGGPAVDGDDAVGARRLQEVAEQTGRDRSRGAALRSRRECGNQGMTAVIR
jgi:hypothetical protein